MTPDPNAIQVTRLPSGLTVVTERMERVETVSLGAYVATGTRNEAAEENGVSHFLEHMAFKGTERRSASAIAEEIEAVGGHINAYTAREQTAYYVKVLKEDTALAADIIGDILTHSTFDPDELERERGVILQEIGQANDTPDDIIFDHFQETAYPEPADGPPGAGHRGADPHHAADHADRLHAPPLRRAEHRHRRGRRAAHEAVVELVKQHFADLPAAEPAPLLVRRPAMAAASSARSATSTRSTSCSGFPSVAYGDPDYYPTLLLSTLLGGGMSSRLFQEIRERRGLVYSIYSFTAPYMDGGLFGIYAGTGESEAEELVPVTLEELRRVQHEVTEVELARARAQVKASLLMSLESTGSRCEQLARQIQVFDRIIPTAETVAKLAAVTTEEVCRAADRGCSAAKPTLAALGPAGKVPGLPAIAEQPGGMTSGLDGLLGTLLDALLDAARAAGADAADAVLVNVAPAYRCSVGSAAPSIWSGRRRATSGCACSSGRTVGDRLGVLGGPGRLSRGWPAAPSTWHGWCRRTRMRGLADPVAGDGDAALDLEDAEPPEQSLTDRAPRRPRMRRWRSPASPIPRARRPGSRAPNFSRDVARVSGPLRPHQPFRVCCRPWPAAARGCSATTTTTAPCISADLEDARRDRAQRR